MAACAVAEIEERCGCGGGHRRWRRLRVSAHHRSLGSPAHACNVSCAHRTIFLDSAAVIHRVAAGTRHGGRARRPPEPATPDGRCAAAWAAVPLSPTPALDTPEGSTWAQTTGAWCLAGLGDARPREALTEAMEIRSAATHPSMAHRSGADCLWPTADPRPAAPPRGARVAGRDLSAVSGLHPLETGAAAAPAAREPGRAAGTLPPWPR